ncbi:hypothetical protein GWE18_14495 [Bradyrhizobium sp. CSA112]|uniref:hypothetical protein n=1 Tax=Bradyrhizobium sp. CSA112 TaxID=2699170 RepID=UPI0023B1CFE1|nr:hypothetical protein [Bradyrhizobium sp. CSA112]MDE5454052.1 hypothetical protein [Bradyrhizobium sp. CSA112]
MPDILERQLHYASKDSDNGLDAAQNVRLIASAERYYRVMYFGARNLGSAGYPYVRHARPHPEFQPLLIFPAICWVPEAQADLRCGLAAAFRAGASLDFLPYRISFCPLASLWRPYYSLAVEHWFLVRMMFVANA